MNIFQKSYMPLLIIVLIAGLFISLLYVNKFTGFAPGDPAEVEAARIDFEPELPKNTVKCLDDRADRKCSTSCWLKSDGAPPSSFQEAEGKIGVIDWNGRCRDVLENIINPTNPWATLCCGDCDCPIGSKCAVGTCTTPEGVVILPPTIAGRLIWPSVCTTITDNFGGSRNHRGIDVDCGIGTDIKAAANGIVSITESGCPDNGNGCNSGFGNYVILKHTDKNNKQFYTMYLHMKESSITISTGDVINAGQIIGKQGDSGKSTTSHFHFSIVAGKSPNPAAYLTHEMINPCLFFDITGCNKNPPYMGTGLTNDDIPVLE